jgi:hypothetical protein
MSKSNKSIRRERDAKYNTPALTVGGETYYAIPVEYRPDYAPDSVESMVAECLMEAQG